MVILIHFCIRIMSMFWFIMIWWWLWKNLVHGLGLMTAGNSYIFIKNIILFGKKSSLYLCPLCFAIIFRFLLFHDTYLYFYSCPWWYMSSCFWAKNISWYYSACNFLESFMISVSNRFKEMFFQKHYELQMTIISL